VPELCWSKKRIFDKALPDCLAEVDAAVAHLKATGAGAVIIGGTSQGGVAALDYASNHPELKAVIAMAPAADPLTPSKYPALMQSLTQAQDFIAAGKGDVPMDMADLASGKIITVHATPHDFLSFHGATSPIGTVRGMEDTVFPKIAMPLLWVAGSSDATQKIGPQAFASVPKNARSRCVTVGADHGGTPDASVDAVLDWLKTLP
jgi:pimeloyl-ACP methyl ester carboxylesterase